ncbi:MAG: hypothetical protein CMJ65_07390 [Planctomycetaceae bacterium]|jgi:hypothetical protein|nr:hypothetical protein [Planctomycetaceae bacterium]MDP7276043.1 DUF1501 domain-containing protein [Planctomycetaceae bacterium]
MRRDHGCRRADHEFSRRGFLATGAAAGVAGLASPAVSKQLRKGQKRVLQIYLQGGVSQLESWDPKPGTRYGGPFRAIPTSVPGMHICELLPHTAQRMHLLSIVRGINLKTNSHHDGRLFMEMGRRSGSFPYVGSIAAKHLTPANAPLPGYLHITTRGLTDNTNAFLDARHAQLKLAGPKVPDNLIRPDALTVQAARRSGELLKRLNRRFSGRGGQKAFTDSYNASFEMAEKLMARRDLFEGKPDPKDLQRYGSHPFGRNCLLARTLLENGATVVKVTHHGYDTHAENFNFHLEQLGEFDNTFCMLLDDLHQSGLLENTLVMVMSEFGRTPKINVRYGRDHWGTAWSIAVGGHGLVPGAIVGATNKEGTEVSEREVDGGHLFHTYLQALGLDSTANHDLGGRTVPIGDPTRSPIKELLA